jgi:hypothetical protein
MSILGVGEATPSRIKGVINYLQQARGKKSKRENLEAILSPKNLSDRNNMIHQVIKECIKMRLLEENQETLEVSINPQINLETKSLSSVISELILKKQDDNENVDFANLLSWFISQDFFDIPTTEEDFREKCSRYDQEVGRKVIKINDVEYGQFKYWSCYLGFAWLSNTAKINQVLLPDPTQYLREHLKFIFNSQTEEKIKIGDFIRKLSKFCPVFETGVIREEIEDVLNNRDDNYLSTVSSISLRRLEYERIIRLEKLSDTEVLILQDGENHPISHITYLGQSA